MSAVLGAAMMPSKAMVFPLYFYVLEQGRVRTYAKRNVTSVDVHTTPLKLLPLPVVSSYVCCFCEAFEGQSLCAHTHKYTNAVRAVLGAAMMRAKDMAFPFPRYFYGLEQGRVRTYVRVILQVWT